MSSNFGPSDRKRSAFQIADIANDLIDPILAKKAGINTMLLNIWDEIVGAEFADSTRPEKIIWPPRTQFEQSESNHGGGLSPGTLTIACEGSRALFFSHQQDEIIARINSFMGFPAIGRIKIVQKVVANQAKPRPKLKKLTSAKQAELANMLADVDDEKLKAALAKLGQAVLSKDK